MTELFGNLLLGFHVAVTPIHFVYCFAGVLMGTLVGVLPGLGAVTTIAMLLPITFKLPPTGALIMLAGVYYGAQYGGSTTAILVNMPGEAASVVTTLDGYQLAKKGRAGVALGMAALASFFAGTVGILVVGLFAVPLAEFGLRFGAAEYFSLTILGLMCVTILGSGGLVKSLAMVALGLLFSTVGTDIRSGTTRFTFGIPELFDGFSFVAMVTGLFAFSEILLSLERRVGREVVKGKIERLLPNLAELRQSCWPVLRATGLGSLIGILPGGGPVIASFGSYALEKKIAKDPSRFGKGAIEGVAGPEAANNAAVQTSFIPLLTLGLPSNPTMALMAAGMTIHGIVPGPQVMTAHPELFWGMIASMWIGNLMLLVLNLPLIGLWVQVLRVPYRLLYPSILLICALGIYSLNNSMFDVGVAAAFGLFGYVLTKLGCQPAPFILAFILGIIMEDNFGRALTISHGELSIFVTRPISLALLLLAAVLVSLVLLSTMRQRLASSDLQARGGGEP